jgi:hypothetical protein
MAFEHFGLYPHMTVAENIGYPLKLRGRSLADVARDVVSIAGIDGENGTVVFDDVSLVSPDRAGAMVKGRVALIERVGSSLVVNPHRPTAKARSKDRVAPAGGTKPLFGTNPMKISSTGSSCWALDTESDRKLARVI